ncbi:F-box domain-containing protein [Mycena venus]|uniref:F-box domain-containing protein n=1 Tax=Mycena venus TaxID=2733690 RepID=A0A8H6YRN6_9AGAR|nr:F-box domain-containing protein [Mycena venus]
MSEREQLEIATELWDEIVGFLSTEDDRQTLQHLNLINRRFHHVARPRLFADFKFHPYSVASDSYGMSAEHLLLPLHPYPQRLRQRLEFWASEDIASLVRDCTVQPLEFEESERAHPPGEDPYALLKAFYEFLPRFVNLKSFDAFTLHFTNLGIANLCLLPKLRTMSVDMCTVAEGETLDTPSKLKLETFRFANSDELEEWWLRGICPDSLHTLGLDLSGVYDQRFFYDLQPSIPTFHNVRSLELALGRHPASHHVATLSRFPGLKELALPRWGGMPGIAINLEELGDAKYCPLLERYYGPAAVLPFLPLSTLTNVTVEPCEPHGFLAKIRSVVEPQSTSRMWYLSVSFVGYLPSLRDLSDLFLNLTILRVTISGRPWFYAGPETDDSQVAVSFFESLPSSLPQQIVKLAINWRFKAPVVLPDMKQLKDDILAQRPTLKTLWIHCVHSAFVWSEMPDGNPSMAMGGPEFADSILPAFEMFFSGFWRSPDFREDEVSTVDL